MHLSLDLTLIVSTKAVSIPLRYLASVFLSPSQTLSSVHLTGFAGSKLVLSFGLGGIAGFKVASLPAAVVHLPLQVWRSES